MDNPARTVAYSFLDHPNAVRRPANLTATSDVPVLAAFDPDNAVIWANDELRRIAERDRVSMRVLRDEDTETLAHEFAKALNYRDIFQRHPPGAERLAAIRNRRTQIVMRSTAEVYANQKLFEERKAEEIAQRIRMEILSSFDRERHGSGLSFDELTTKSEESAADVVKTLRKDYLDSARREFIRLNSALRPVDARTPGNLSTPAPDGKVLKMDKIRWLFPTKLSPTLADLIDEMISFQIDIVIDPSEV